MPQILLPIEELRKTQFIYKIWGLQIRPMNANNLTLFFSKEHGFNRKKNCITLLQAIDIAKKIPKTLSCWTLKTNNSTMVTASSYDQIESGPINWYFGTAWTCWWPIPQKVDKGESLQEAGTSSNSQNWNTSYIC